MADVTDLVLADAKTLSRRLAPDDRHTLDEFMEMIRGIELRIEKMDRLLADVDVQVPKNEARPRGEYIQLQMDLMLLAFQMGLTNVSTFMIGRERWDATLMYEGVFDRPVQHHNMTHNQKGDGYKELQKIDIFHLQQYACLIRPMIIAGKAQGQIKQGRFIKMPSGTLNSNLWLTIAQMMGLELNSYADSSGVISDLWTQLTRQPCRPTTKNLSVMRAARPPSLS